jgi:hypothetical protein
LELNQVSLYFVHKLKKSFCPFSFGHCVVYPSSIYGSRLPLWYLQALLMHVFLSIIK